MHVLTTRINNKDLGSHPVKRRIGVVEFFSRGGEGEKRRRGDGGRDRARKFNSMVDFATQSAGLLPVHAPMDEGIIPSHAYNCSVDRVSPSKLFSESD